MKAYAVPKKSGITIEFTNILVIIELGTNININQKGRIPNVLQIYIFSNVKYS